jgi:hypothetical protein
MQIVIISSMAEDKENKGLWGSGSRASDKVQRVWLQKCDCGVGTWCGHDKMMSSAVILLAEYT